MLMTMMKYFTIIYNFILYCIITCLLFVSGIRKRKSVKVSPLNPKAYVGPYPLGRDRPSNYKGPYRYRHCEYYSWNLVIYSFFYDSVEYSILFMIKWNIFGQRQVFTFCSLWICSRYVERFFILSVTSLPYV